METSGSWIAIRRICFSRARILFRTLPDATLKCAPVLSVGELRKQYGDTIAVDGVSFEVNRNEIVGLLGLNGAGKSTTINMILGVLEPSSGTILVEGADLATRRSQVLARTDFAAVYAPLPVNLTVIQNLRFFGLIYGVKNLASRLEALLEQFDLRPFAIPSAACFLPASRRAPHWPKPRSTIDVCCCSMSQPRRSILPWLAKSASGSANLRRKAKAASCRRRTTCMRLRMCAIACCFSRTAGYCSQAIPGRYPPSTARTRSKISS
jgi:energy-coupling factor transporter ATP-binding protein EcfA2